MSIGCSSSDPLDGLIHIAQTSDAFPEPGLEAWGSEVPEVDMIRVSSFFYLKKRHRTRYDPYRLGLVRLIETVACNRVRVRVRSFDREIRDNRGRD